MQRRRNYNNSTGRFKYYLHSIPKLLLLKEKAKYSINEDKEVKSNVLYSIPTRLSKLIPSACILVLLLGLFICLNPVSSTSLVYATVETKGDSTASITLDTSNIVVDARYDEVSYASKDITISINNVESYALTITSTTSLTGGTVFTGADNKTPEEMEYNSWGYAYTNTEDINSTDDLSTLTYHSFTGETQTLESSSTNTTDSNNTSSPNSGNRILAFAAKFGNDAIPTTYHADIKLSLVSTPNQVVFDGITTMQEMTPEICSKAEIGDSTILKDDRSYPIIDGEQVFNTYRVTKLEDNRCWMTENLRITGDGTGTQITPNNSDVSSNYTLPVSSISGFSDNTASNVYLGADNAGNVTGYYTWCAATANTCNSATTNGTQVTSSICPKGWVLPTGGTNSINTDFYNLFNKINQSTVIVSSTLNTKSYTGWSANGLATIQDLPYHFAYTGYMGYGSLSNTDSYGAWWSRTAINDTEAYYLDISSNRIYPGTNNTYRYGGLTVRCIAASPIQQIETMQEMTTDICDKSSVGDYSILTDTRDKSTYSVRKMADGKCWMTQNLRIMDKTIDSTDSDMTSGSFTIPASATGTTNLGWGSAMSDTDSYAPHAYLGKDNSGTNTGYYNWYTATAGAGDKDFNARSENAESSICPKGWRLPMGGLNKTGDEVNEFYNLTVTMLNPGFAPSSLITNWHYSKSSALINVQDTPYNFTNTGFVRDSSYYGTSAYPGGLWWSSTVESDYYTCLLLIDSSDVYPGTRDSTGRYYGLAMRCVAK